MPSGRRAPIPVPASTFRLILLPLIVVIGSVAALLAQSGSDAVHRDLQAHFASQVEPRYAGATRFTFAVTGDIHLSQSPVFVLTKAEWKNVLAGWRDAGHLFGIVAGDLSYGAYEDIDAVVTGWAETPGAPPVYYTMGNHERDEPAGKRAWIDRLYPAAVRAESWSPTISRPGNSDRAYWAFNVGPYWRFIVLDADIVDPDDGKDFDATVDAQQLAWIEADLGANRDRNVMVFVHQPIDQARYDTPYYTLSDRGLLMDVLSAHPKQKFVFSGHLHGYRGITKWKGITAVHTSELQPTSAAGVTVSIDGEEAVVSWPGMTEADTVLYDQHSMYRTEVIGAEVVLRVGEEGGDYGQTRSQAMAVVTAQNGVTPTYGTKMLKASSIDWYDSWFISEQLVRVVPGMKFSYDIYLQNVSSGKDAVTAQPSWVMSGGATPPLVADENGLALSRHTRDARLFTYYEDLPRLGGRATGQWYHREIDLTAFAGQYADGVWFAAAAGEAVVGAAYVDNIQFRWPVSQCTGSITPTLASVPASGGSGTIAVTADSSCAWTASSNSAWLTIASGATGAGSGWVAYSVLPNSLSSSRSAAITAAGRTFTVTQSGAALDTTPPTIVARSPAPGATGVAVTSAVTVRFDEPIAPWSVTSTTLRLRAAGAAADQPSNVSASGDTATLTPQSPLAGGTSYEVTVGSDVHDLAGNRLGADLKWSFTTAASVGRPGLVAAFGFDEGAGAAVNDASGNGNSGAIAGATWTSGGRYGSALAFDGLNDWITVNDAASLRLSGAMTLEAWVYPVATSAWQSILLKEAGSTGLRYALYAQDAGTPPSAYVNTGGGDRGITAPSALTRDAWSHLAATYDGNTMRVYVNGAEAASTSVAGAIASSTSPLRIGGNAVWGEYFSGRIDEVRIYNRSLTLAEIQADMNEAVAPSAPLPQVTVEDVSVTEGDGAISSATFVVQLSEAATGNVSVAYATGGGTATAGADYTARAGMLTFAPGETTSTIPIAILGDVLDEDDESFTMALSAPSGAKLARSQATATLLDDDPLPELSVTGSAVAEGNMAGTTLAFTIVLSRASGRPVTVSWLTENASAIGGSDYTSASGVATFAPGTTTSSVRITVQGDVAVEADETLAVRLASATNAVIAAASAIGTIVNDDAADTTPPALIATTPVAGSTGVATTSKVTARFTELVHPASFTTATFSLRAAGASADVPASVSVSGDTATLTPASTLSAATTYSATVRGSITDVSGNALGGDATWSFTTAAPATGGVVAAYGFNEGTGATVADASGGGHTGSIAGAAWSPAGKFGPALRFDGTNDRVDIADAAALDLTTGMTLEAWVYPTATSDWRTVIMKENGGGLAYALYSHDDNARPAAYIHNGTDRGAAGTTQVAANTWTHLAATYDGTTLRLYKNATLVRSLTVGLPIVTSANALRIGGNLAWGEYFAGMIDEVRVYNRALSASEIQADMGTPLP